MTRSAVHLEPVSNHPNRSKTNRGAGSNPTPAEIMRLREDAGMTQDQIGALLYSGRRTWQDWEAGERRMHPASWELVTVKLNARKMLEKDEITEAMLRRLGVYLPLE